VLCTCLKVGYDIIRERMRDRNKQMSFSKKLMPFSKKEKEEMNSMGSTNQLWGVCGFTSTFYAMYALNPGKRPLLVGAGITTRVLAEIKTYLMMLKAEGNIGLLNEIEKFTRSFGVTNGNDFRTFAVDEYIKRINQSVGKTEKDITGDPYYSIGMPPAAVADYLRRIWGYDSEILTIKEGWGGSSNGIMGVKSKTRGMSLYDGLCHYLYRYENKIYSWGFKFSSLSDVNRKQGKDYQLCCLIKIKQQLSPAR
jgi:hypothetical protein